MNTDIYEATKKGTVIVLMGHDRTHAIGSTAYQFERRFFPNGMGETLARFAKGYPVAWMDDEWKSLSGSVSPVITLWRREVTLLEVRDYFIVVGDSGLVVVCEKKQEDAQHFADTLVAKCDVIKVHRLYQRGDRYSYASSPKRPVA